ncbi:MAG: collagen-like protein [Bdellovibrionales bacterium]|nr:collagen-like protein [Bdellovibrionales bacterium]
MELISLILVRLACYNGGVSIFTFHDDNSNGLLDTDELVIKVKALCNGLNGSDGQDGEDGQDGTNGTNASLTLETVISSATCPNGGVKFTNGSATPVEICNGVNGLNGADGLAGLQGIPGLAGSNGTDGSNGQDGSSVTPVTFCANASGNVREYGLMIGDELYAVRQASLVKLDAAEYESNEQSNCIYKI